MTKPVRHTSHEIRNAAEQAKRLGIAVRLEKDGSITFMPDIHKPETYAGIDDAERIEL